MGAQANSRWAMALLPVLSTCGSADRPFEPRQARGTMGRCLPWPAAARCAPDRASGQGRALQAILQETEASPMPMGQRTPQTWRIRRSPTRTGPGRPTCISEATGSLHEQPQRAGHDGQHCHRQRRLTVASGNHLPICLPPALGLANGRGQLGAAVAVQRKSLAVTVSLSVQIQ